MIQNPSLPVQSPFNRINYIQSENPTDGTPVVVDENGWTVASPELLLQLAEMRPKYAKSTPEQRQQEQAEYWQQDDELEAWRQSQANDDEAGEVSAFEPVVMDWSYPTDLAADEDDQERQAADRERAEQLVMHCLRNPKLFEDARGIVGRSQFTAVNAWGLAEVWQALSNTVDEFGIEVMEGDAWPQRCKAELRRHIKHPPNQVDFVFGNSGMPESGLLYRAFTPPVADFPESQGHWLLQQFCTSSLLIARLERLVQRQDVARKDPKAFTDQVLRVIEDFGKIGGTQGQSMFMSPEEFANKEFKLDWLVPGVLVEGQPCVAGGPSKGMKTSVMIDLAVSIGVGESAKFLGHFPVKNPGKRVGFISGESGGATIKETFKRVCEARGVELAQCNVYPEFRLPKLGDPKELRYLASQVKERGLSVVIVDPAYLTLLAGKPKANPANLFEMGEALSDVGCAIQEAGATPVLVHHAVKHLRPGDRDGQFEPMTREDLAMSGFAEYMRQWILINRRAKYEDESGKHELWLGLGGSAGFSGTWALDILEGEVKEDWFFRVSGGPIIVYAWLQMREIPHHARPGCIREVARLAAPVGG